MTIGFRPHRGATLIEAMTAILVLGAIVVGASAIIGSSRSSRVVDASVATERFAESVLSGLLRLNFDDIGTMTDGDVVGMAHGIGVPVVSASPDGSSSVRTVMLRPSAFRGASDRFTSLTLLTGHLGGDVSMLTDMWVTDVSPADWGAGIVFGYKDLDDHFALLVRKTGVDLVERRGGAEFIIASSSTLNFLEEWRTLELEIIGSDAVMRIDGSAFAVVTDEAVRSGHVGLVGEGDSIAHFRNTTMVEGGVLKGSLTDGREPGQGPRNAFLVGQEDVSDFDARLSVQPAVYSDDVREVALRISWADEGGVRTRDYVTLMSRP